jgi:hypothetical protein
MTGYAAISPEWWQEAEKQMRRILATCFSGSIGDTAVEPTSTAYWRMQR